MDNIQPHRGDGSPIHISTEERYRRYERARRKEQREQAMMRKVERLTPTPERGSVVWAFAVVFGVWPDQ